MLLLYTDGGPDHRITYISVQVALICLFLSLNLDYLLAARTAPYHSWRNPVERIMSTLNLGLQSVGLMRQAGDETFENEIHKCKNMDDMRKKSSENDSFRTASLDSVAPVKALHSQVFQRLELKEKSIKMGTAVSQADIDAPWKSLLSCT